MSLSKKKLKKAEALAERCLSKPIEVPISAIGPMPRPLKPRCALTPEQRARCEMLFPRICDVYSISLKDWVDGFEMEYDPQQEIVHWEIWADALEAAVAELPGPAGSLQELRKSVFEDVQASEIAAETCWKEAGGIDLDKAGTIVKDLNVLFHFLKASRKYGDAFQAARKQCEAKFLLAKNCQTCGHRAYGLKACNACRKVWYCDRTCQKQDWQRHKQQCSSLQGGAAGAERKQQQSS
jgi:hypothetical protein